MVFPVAAEIGRLKGPRTDVNKNLASSEKRALILAIVARSEMQVPDFYEDTGIKIRLQLLTPLKSKRLPPQVPATQLRKKGVRNDRERWPTMFSRIESPHPVPPRRYNASGVPAPLRRSGYQFERSLAGACACANPGPPTKSNTCCGYRRAGFSRRAADRSTKIPQGYAQVL